MPCILWLDGYMIPPLHSTTRNDADHALGAVSQERRQHLHSAALTASYTTHQPNRRCPSVAEPDKRYFTQPGLTARSSSKGGGHGEEPAPLHPPTVLAPVGGLGGAGKRPPK